MAKHLGRRAILKSAAIGAIGVSCKRRDAPTGQTATQKSEASECRAQPSSRSLVVAFGSCNKPWLSQPLWPKIRALCPTVFAWLGDIVYTEDGETDALPWLYRQQAKQPEYAALREQTRIVGVWDDHDYGWNNGGKNFAGRDQAKAALLEFLGEPAVSERRDRPGVYASYTFGEPGTRVKLILLDVRYFRDDPGPAADTLGEQQWQWLERELSQSDARLHLLASSIQILPTEHPYEKWANFPMARKRLLDLITRSGTRGVVLLSGDRHIAELSRLEHSALSYPLFELTSSGMTHSWKEHDTEPNQLRVSPLYTDLNFGSVTVNFATGELTLAVHGVAAGSGFEHRVPLASLGAG